MNAGHKHRIEAVNDALADRMADLARTLAGAEPTSRSATEWRFRGRGSLAVVVGGPKRGAWHDHEAGVGGDPLGLVAHLRGTPMRDAAAWAGAWLGDPAASEGRAQRQRPVASPHAPRAASDADPRKQWSRNMADRLWCDAVPAAGTLAESYLRSRGLALPADAPLRFHANAWRNAANGPPGPAMLARMTAPETGVPCGVHVTYLRADGAGKASGERPKVMLGTSGVIRLVPDEAVTNGLGLAEGVETCIAVLYGFGWSPAWAAGSASAIRGFPVLPGVECLTILPTRAGLAWRQRGHVAGAGPKPGGKLASWRRLRAIGTTRCRAAGRPRDGFSGRPRCQPPCSRRA